MIKVLVVKSRDDYRSFKVSGHANFDDYGRDIVCAAISVLTQTAASAVSELAHIEPKIVVNEKTGLLSCELPRNLDENKQHTVNIIVGTFLVGIRGVLDQYPKYLQLKIEEVDSDAKV